MRAAALVVAACATAPPVVQTPPRAEVRVAPAECLTGVEAAIEQTLADHHAEHSGLIVEVAAQNDDVSLRVVRPNGDVGLDRHYSLAAADCASAPQLLALGVDRLLSSFPEWAEPPAPPRPRPERWLELAGGAALSGIAPPIGIEGELAGLADLGGAVDRFGASLAARSGIPQAAGAGRFREIALLGGATWRHRFTQVETRIELRAGALRVNGIGFAPDNASWLPWWEVALLAGRRWSWGTLGGELAATALRDHAVTRDGLVSQDIPLVRLGISGTFDLYTP
jgi:hypothetical protein